jgi:hypothetical protein
MIGLRASEMFIVPKKLVSRVAYMCKAIRAGQNQTDGII